MNTAFKQRMAGAIFILSLGVILIPVILEKPNEQPLPQYSEKPATPSLPNTKTVANIKYVFNEIEDNYNVAAEQNPAPIMTAGYDAQDKPDVFEDVSSKSEETPSRAAAQARQASQEVMASLHPGDWTIQLGAFGSRENANGLLAKLTAEGFESYLKEVPGRDLVRVFVAPGIDHDDAEALLGELNTEMGLKGIIVRFRD
jgi:DedD protein